MIASAQPHEREWKLKQQLEHKESGQSLLAPHSAYNEFAAPFGCQIWPEKPFWHQDLDMEEGVKLRIYGLTSTLLSGQNGDDDVQGSLYLGPRQTVLNPVPNTANLVLVHHPVDWLADADAVDDALTSRAVFHLFGHKHRQRAVMAADYIRIGAGAINPSRYEQPYQPGYNLIGLQVSGTGAGRHIKVDLRQRRLQDNPECFVAITNGQGGDVFQTNIPVPEEAPLPTVSSPRRAQPPINADAQHDPADEGATQDAEAAMGEPDTRDLLYRFWRLTSAQRRTIAQDLGLLENGEMGLPEPERYGRALIRAGERNLIDEVAASVAKLEH
jgi:hypothetical protein